ncbi:hypothetical protein [Actinomadura sp. 21ATH]|uniref:hypothetical protein n=1 Tax=Actinomadura sp. 21ATH TaxID=1735444 RepID=UPI0035C191C8
MRGLGDESFTTPDPSAGPGPGPQPGPVPVPDAGPVPPPWTTPPAAPPGWDAPPPSGDGERTISLSDEPWEHEQWAEEVWSPGPTAKKQALPYVLIGGGLVVLMLVAAAIIFWPSGSDPAAGPAAGSSSAGPGGSSDPAAGPDGEEPTTTSDGALNKQAGQVDALLTEMASTRSELGTAVTAGCRTADLQRIYDQRQEQLRKARALDVSALESGTELRDALVRALTASSASNKTYVDMSPGCPSESDVASVNGEASAAKRDFIGYWRPNAEKAGLDVRTADTI